MDSVGRTQEAGMTDRRRRPATCAGPRLGSSHGVASVSQMVILV